MVPNLSKNEQIRLTRIKTQQRRSSMSIKSYTLKIDKSHLSKTSYNQLKRMFIEAKWYYNHILGNSLIFTKDTYKLTQVSVKVKDQFENRDIIQLPAQIRQSISEKIKKSVYTLAKSKKKGIKVGKLKYKSEVLSLPLNQHKNSYTLLLTKNRLKLARIKQKIRVRGMSQIPKDVEIANSILMTDGTDYWLKVTCYVPKESPKNNNSSIGIDFGIKDTVTLSDGSKTNIKVANYNKLRRLNKSMSRKRPKPKSKKSKNYLKAQIKFRKAHKKDTNRRDDQRKKLVSGITKNYDIVCFQDDSIASWSKNGFGKQISQSALGGIIRDLKSKSHTPIIVDRYFASTKTCSNCGYKQNMELSDRIYTCPVCGLVLDRDVNSAKSILKEGLRLYSNKIPTEHRDLKPVEKSTSSNSDVRVSKLTSVKQEALTIIG